MIENYVDFLFFVHALNVFQRFANCRNYVSLRSSPLTVKIMDNSKNSDMRTYKDRLKVDNKLHIRVDVRDIDIAHRMGAFKADGNRPVICKFVSRMLKTRIIRERRKIKGTKIVLRDDLTLKNQKLLEDTFAVSNVKSVWSDNG